jgi:hypothetical protein
MSSEYERERGRKKRDYENEDKRRLNKGSLLRDPSDKRKRYKRNSRTELINDYRLGKLNEESE